MPLFKDLTGQRFGNLTVLERTNEKSGNNYKWLCRCDCGELTCVRGDSLTSGISTYCLKCKHKHTIKDLTGQKFGSLIVLEITNEKSNETHYKWLCRCDCGELTRVSGSNLTSGTSTRCLKCGYKHMSETKTRFSFEEVNIHTLMSSTQSKARQVNRSFELTYDEYATLIFQNCFYCGAKPSNFSKADRLGDPGIYYNGIDRVDNNKGYVTGNCVSCCWECNQYKHNASIEWIINAAKRLHEGYKIDKSWNPKSELKENCVHWIFNRYKSNAKHNNRNFSLTFEQVGALVSDNCFYCDKPASESKRIIKGQKVPYHGIDRVNNSKGYEIDNVVSCCFGCNYLKRDMPLDWLFNVANQLSQFLEAQPEHA